MLSDLIWWSGDRGPLRGYFPESLEEERVVRVGVGVRGQREVSKTLHPHPRCCLTRGRSFFGYTLRQFQKKVLAVLLKLIFQSGNTELCFFGLFCQKTLRYIALCSPLQQF